MADVKISALPDATTANGADELPIIQGGVTKRLTLTELLALVTAYVPGGTDVAVADGGTGASTASGARTNLGLVIGTNVQAWDATLDTWANKTVPSGAVVGISDTQTLSAKTFVAPALGTPASGNLSNCTNIPADEIVGIIPIANLATGTPDGTKFVKDDGTLAVPAGGSAITVQDEGTPLATAATTLNFTGAGVTATGTGATKTIDIPGAGSATITVKENGTNVSTAITALDFLGADFDVTESPAGEANIVISSAIARTADVQPLDTDLTAIAALTSAADKLPYATGAGTWALTDISAAARTVLDDASTAAMLTTLGAQPVDATLTALAALTIAANSLSIGSGADAFTQTTFAANTIPGRSSTGNLVAKTVTDAGFALLDDADASAMRTTLGLAIGTNVQAYDADLTTWGGKTAPSGVVVGDTDAQSLSAKTLVAPVVSGIAVYDGANVTTANAIGALAIDVTKGLNTKSISADSTFTFSGTPATANTWFQIAITNTDTAPHILTIPSSFSLTTGAARTTFPIAASGRAILTFRYDGSGYWVFGDSGYFNKYDATTAPGVGDDVADGYGPGSLWYDATGNTLYINESNGAGAAVWTTIAGSGGAGTFTDLTATGNTILGNASTDTLNVGNGGIIKDAAGAVGIGVTPSPWRSTYESLDLNTRGLGLAGGTDSANISVNAYYDETDNRWEYKGTSSFGPTKVEFYDGGITFSRAVSGTAAAAITWIDVLNMASTGAVTSTGTGLTSGEMGFRNIPQNSQSAAYTAVALDAGKHILHPSADTTARIFTIPANSSVAYPLGTAITFINQNGAGVITIAITTDTMRLAGAGTTGSRTLAANGIATAIKLTSTEWIISGTGLT